MDQLKRHLPTRDHLRNVKSLQFLSHLIFEPNLWHFNRHSVSYAALVGFFCCFLPIPLQMIPAVLLCVWLHCNVPLAVAIVWISNPITMPPMFYFAYRVGLWILGQPEQPFTLQLSFTWLAEQLTMIWQPLILGSLICGTTLGLLSFGIIRFWWGWRVRSRWLARRKRRKLARHLVERI